MWIGSFSIKINQTRVRMALPSKIPIFSEQIEQSQRKNKNNELQQAAESNAGDYSRWIRWNYNASLTVWQYYYGTAAAAASAAAVCVCAFGFKFENRFDMHCYISFPFSVCSLSLDVVSHKIDRMHATASSSSMFICCVLRWHRNQIENVIFLLLVSLVTESKSNRF